jgi:alanine-glyoxylate transaminase/serine-glyoxylate transaminase/serine-pyruvate transaminase
MSSHHDLSRVATRIPGRRFLQSPGPTPLPDAVLHALMGQPMDLGDPRVDQTIAACEVGVQALLGQQPGAGGEVFFFIANGHGAWEAAVANFVPPGGLALLPGTGHFSEGWAQQAEAMGRRVQRLPWVEGEPLDPAALQVALQADAKREIAAVLVVHTDTSSGVTSDLAALRAAHAASGHPALFIVDLVASLAAEPFDFDALGVDVALGASQKGLMCPPGLAFIAAHARALAVAEARPGPRSLYWDIPMRRSPLSYRKFCGTPPFNLLAALRAALGLLEQEGLPQVLARHRRLAGLVHAAVAGWAEAGAVGFFARDPACRSAAVTTVTVPPGTDVDALRRLAREDYQVAFAGALGPLQGRAFRIGHLGDHHPAQLLGTLAAIEAALRVQGVPVGDGVGRAVRLLTGS